MNKVLIGLMVGLLAYMAFLVYRNSDLSEQLGRRDAEICSLKETAEMAKENALREIEAIQAKYAQDKEVAAAVDIKRKECQTDEKAIAIISIGVPDCLQ